MIVGGALGFTRAHRARRLRALAGRNADSTHTFALTTTDATPTLMTLPGPPLTLQEGDEVTVLLDAKCESGNDKGGFYEWIACKRLAGAGVALVGTKRDIVTAQLEGAVATAAITMVVSGNTLAVQCTGVAATTIAWTATMTVFPAAQG